MPKLQRKKKSTLGTNSPKSHTMKISPFLHPKRGGPYKTKLPSHDLAHCRETSVQAHGGLTSGWE